jgi:pimeloyl-ACP methyl ester carboxylesterase
MKSIHFKSPVSPTPADLRGMMPDALRHLRGACLNGAAEGAALAVQSQLTELQKRFLPGEEGLAGLMAGAYAAMVREPSFLLCGSAVPFCLSPNPKGGHYFLHTPRKADRSTPLLLLIHGYGGNLLFFPWAIHQAMREAILVAPSWQIDWSEGKFDDRRDYLEMALADAADRLGFKPQEIWLVALSQGGPTAFQMAAANPGKFRGLLGISTNSGGIDPQTFPKRFPVRFLHGDEDARIRLDSAERTIRELQRAGGDAKCTILGGATHWLLLSHPAELKKFLGTNVQ